MKLNLTLILATVMLVSCGESSRPSDDAGTGANSATARTGGGQAKPPDVDLMTAVINGDIAAVGQHVAAGSDLNRKEKNGDTPLNTACVIGKTDIAEALIESGADLTIKNNAGTDPLYNAAFFCHLDIVGALLAKGANVNTTDPNGTPIQITMDAPWNAVEGIYRVVFSSIGIPFDADRIERTRPQIAKMLREHAGQNSPKTPVAVGPTRPASEVANARRNLPPVSTADWSTYNHDVRGWRFNAAEKSLSPANASRLEEKWRFPEKGSSEQVGAIHATPTIVNGHAYFGTATFPAFYKLKPDGSLAWVYRLKSGQSSRALPQGGVNTIDAANGILTSALVTQSGVYFGNSAGVFFALDRITGEELWNVDTRAVGFPDHHAANIFNASAILADGKVIVGGGGYEHPYPLDPNYPCCTGRGFVVAFDPATGEVLWKYDVGEKPKPYPEPLVFEDSKGRHVFKFGPSTSSVWSTPSYDDASGTIFFGTDVHNAPRKPTADNPRYDTDYSAAVVAVDVKTGQEKWVTQLNTGDVYNHSLASFDPKTGLYKDGSVGDTPKIYSIDVDGKQVSVVGVGCKNGGFYVLRAVDGKLVANTPVFSGKPQYPLTPATDPRMIALPCPLGGIQTGCATDGTNVYTNGIDWLKLNTKQPGTPEGGRVVSVSGDLSIENWRHERPKIQLPSYSGGDPVGSGIALGGGIVCFTPTITEVLVILDASSGEMLKQLPIGTVWAGPSISRGRVFIGTGSILFLKKQTTGTLYSFGLPGNDEISRMGAGNE